MKFLEFIEDQEPFIVEAQSTLLGFRRRMQAVRRRLVQLGVAVLLVGSEPCTSCWLILATPAGCCRPPSTTTSVHYGLVLLLVLLIARLVFHMRKPQRRRMTRYNCALRATIRS